MKNLPVVIVQVIILDRVVVIVDTLEAGDKMIDNYSQFRNVKFIWKHDKAPIRG